jgi:N-acyl-D-aspartate/D-glutamate deacylase
MSIRSRFRSLAERRKQVEKNLAEGALGVSHSLEYQPAPTEELLGYAMLARRYDRPLILHLRYSDPDRELDGVDEAIGLARRSGARVHIAHLHSTGGTYRMEAALERIRSGIAEGLGLTACVYPYSYWATYLSSRRFDPGWQQRFGLTYGDLRVVGSGECLTAESFARYRRTGALVAVPEGTMPLSRTFDRAIREDFCMIGSDGGIQREPRANSHPRGAGCFSTAVRHLMDTGMPLERILEKVTLLPRSLVLPAMRERGVLEEGRAADLTVFDPAAIRGLATVDNPNQFSAGIEVVLVNGRIACQDGAVAERGGTAIRAME